MLSGSYMVIARKHSEIGVAALLGVVVSQALGYGLVFDVNFFFRCPARPQFSFISDSIGI